MKRTWGGTVKTMGLVVLLVLACCRLPVLAAAEQDAGSPERGAAAQEPHEDGVAKPCEELENALFTSYPAAHPETWEERLATLFDYNGFVDGHHSSNGADYEGPVAVSQDSTMFGHYSYGAAFVANPNIVGEEIQASQYISLLLGGRIYKHTDQHITVCWYEDENGIECGDLVTTGSVEQWVSEVWVPGSEDARIYTLGDDPIAQQFSNLRQERQAFVEHLNRLVQSQRTPIINEETQQPWHTHDTRHGGASENEHNIYSVGDGVLVIEIPEQGHITDLSIPYQIIQDPAVKQIIVYCAGEQVSMMGSMHVNQNSDEDYRPIAWGPMATEYAEKLTFYFPNARQLTNYLEKDGAHATGVQSDPTEANTTDDHYSDAYFEEKDTSHHATMGSVVAPGATVVFKSGSINGYLFCKDFHQRDSNELHNFHNPWAREIEEPEDISCQIAGTKTLEGRDLQAGEFTFSLQDSNGLELERVTNGADGTFAFSPLVFSAPGVYPYRVQEVSGGEEGMQYDRTVFEVEITVESAEGEKLEAAIVYKVSGNTTQGAHFKNRYVPVSESVSSRPQDRPPSGPSSEVSTPQPGTSAQTSPVAGGGSAAISQPPVNNGGAPKTGDTFHLPLLAGLVACSLVGMAVLLVLRRHKTENE